MSKITIRGGGSRLPYLYIHLSVFIHFMYIFFTTLLYVHVSNCAVPLNGFVTGNMALLKIFFFNLFCF